MNIFGIWDLAKIKNWQLSGYSWLIILVGASLIGGLWSFVHYQINHDYDRTIAEASQETMNLTVAFEEHVRRIIATADDDLLNLKKAYEQDGIPSPLFAAYAQTAAKDPARYLVAAYNEKGVVVASYIQDFLNENRSDRDYFRVPQEANSDKLVIGKTSRGRITGHDFIPLTRRVNKPDGSFGGIVFIGLRSDYFLSFYQKINLGENQLIFLSGTDGFNRARQVGDNLTPGQNIRGSETWKNVQTGRPNASFLSTSIMDGINRVTSYRIMPEYPLIVAVGKSAQVALAEYEKRRQGYILGASATSLFILAFCVLLIGRHESIKKLTVAVQQKKDWLSSLVNSISDEVWFVDTRKSFTLINPAAIQEFRLNDSEIDAEKFASSLEVLRPDGSPRPADEAPPIRALQGETIRNQQQIVRTPASGDLRHREVNASPVRDAGGNIIGSVSVVRDITERKAIEDALREEKLFSESLLLNSAMPTYVIDAKHKVLVWNRACEKLTGIPAKAILGTSEHQEIFNGQSLPTLVDLVVDGKPIPPERFSVYYPSDLVPHGMHAEGWRVCSGISKYLSSDAAPIVNTKGEIIAGIQIVRDLTVSKKNEEALEQSLDLAAQIQIGFMPPPMENDWMKVKTIYRPRQRVSGDLFDYYWDSVDKRLTGILVDVMGHGLGAALQTSALKVLFHQVVADDLSPSQKLSWINSNLSSFQGDSFIAAICFIVDFKKKQLRYASGGINNFLVVSGNQSRIVSTPGSLLGINDTPEFEEITIPIANGDSLFFMSDGLFDLLSGPPEGGDFCSVFSNLENLALSTQPRDDITAICINIAMSA